MIIIVIVNFRLDILIALRFKIHHKKDSPNSFGESFLCEISYIRN